MEAYTYPPYMITPNLEWPHNSEITADTSQTTVENYILIPKSLSVGEVAVLEMCLYLGEP